MSRLQAGKHVVTVCGAYMTQSQTGTAGLVFKFENLEGSIDCTLWVTSNTADRVIKDLETLGFPKAKLSDMGNLEKLQDYTMGHEVKIVVEDEEYQGKYEPKVKWINEVGAMRKEDPAIANRIFSILAGGGAPLVSAPRSRPAASAPASPPAPANSPAPFSPDDDVPF